jgi:hypothetical protein
MPSYRVLIDDGEVISFDAQATFSCIEVACKAIAQTAAIIAADRCDLMQVEQVLSCEVQEDSVGPRREFDVVVKVVERA